MLRPILLALCITASCVPSAMAQWTSGTAAAGNTGNTNLPTSDVRMTEGNTVPWGDYGPDPYYMPAIDNTHTSTTRQSSWQPITSGIGGFGSTTAGSAPFAGTHFAPSNLGLRTLSQGMSLPPTTLDSFVYRMGFDDHAFGDESTQGPPPYNGSWDPLTFPADGLDQHLPKTD